MLSKHQYPREFADLVGELPDVLPAIPDLDWSRLSKITGRSGTAEAVETAEFAKAISGIDAVVDSLGLPVLRKQKTSSTSLADIVRDTIAAMDTDDLLQNLASPAPAPSASDLQKRKQDFVAKTAPARAEKLSAILCDAVRALEEKGINTERFDFTRLHRSMNDFVEGVLLAA